MNTHIEMVMEWPSKQDDVHPVYVRAVGRVVRSHDTKTAVRMSFCRMVVDKATFPPRAAGASSVM